MPDPVRLLGGDSFVNETFEGVDLAGADLGGKELVGCTLKGAKLAETRWSRARLEACTFEGCDLSRASPKGLVARAVTFVDCRLMGIEWTELGSFPELAFSGCDLRYASFVTLVLRKLLFRNCDLRDAQLVEVDLAGATFENCRLAGARFDRCDLRNASFADSVDLVLEPQRNKVAGARVPMETAVHLAESFGLTVIGF
jgi:fluoroquinolone resistance protein